MDKKYQIFISSTFNDLKLERQKVTQAILGIYNFPIGMEMFHADNEEQWEQIKKTIDMSDYYVLILGRYCGTLIENENISYTEKEYNYALSKGIPILSFIISEDAQIKSYGIETSKQINALKKFKRKVMKLPCEFWNNADDLAYKVTKTLSIKIKETKRNGWIRNNPLGINISPIEDTKIIGEYEVLYLRNKDIINDCFVHSKLIIRNDATVSFYNNCKQNNECEYSYDGMCETIGNIIYIHLKNNDSFEKVIIQLINPVGNMKRFLGIIMGLSSNNSPVCNKIVCYKKELEKDIKFTKIKNLLVNKNSFHNESVLMIEDNDRELFYSDAIFV